MVKGNPTEFAKVDQSVDPTYFIDFVDSRRTIEGEREVKELILRLLELRAGAHVLDIGSGTGDDAREIAGLVGASGRVVGIDASDAMVAEAKSRAAGCANIEFRTGDACKLEFPESSFDAVRTDRVFVFVPEIELALAEGLRVLRSGGVLVTSEIDFETQFIDSSMPEISRKLFAEFAQENSQPCLGRRLLRLVTQAGFIKVRSIARVVQPPYTMFRRMWATRLQSAVQRGQLSHNDMTQWSESMEQAQDGGFFNQGVIIFTVCGQKP